MCVIRLHGVAAGATRWDRERARRWAADQHVSNLASAEQRDDGTAAVIRKHVDDTTRIDIEIHLAGTRRQRTQADEDVLDSSSLYVLNVRSRRALIVRCGRCGQPLADVHGERVRVHGWVSGWYRLLDHNGDPADKSLAQCSGCPSKHRIGWATLQSDIDRAEAAGRTVVIVGDGKYRQRHGR